MSLPNSTEKAWLTTLADHGERQAAHCHAIRLRFSDLDWQGHINNVSTIEYLQEAQIRLLDPDCDKIFQEAEQSFVVAAHSVDYLHPIQFREHPLVVKTIVVELGRAKVVLNSQIVDDQEIYARSISTYVAYDTTVRAVRPLTTFEQSELASYLRLDSSDVDLNIGRPVSKVRKS